MHAEVYNTGSKCATTNGHTSAAAVLVVVPYCVVERNRTGAHACISSWQEKSKCATIKMVTTQQQQQQFF
jgi:hypothetical protein